MLYFTQKVLLTKNFYSNGTLLNKKNYRKVLERLRHIVFRHEIASDWILHHDNTPTSTALSVYELYAKKKFQCFSNHRTVLTWSWVKFFATPPESKKTMNILHPSVLHPFRERKESKHMFYSSKVPFLYFISSKYTSVKIF